MKELRVAMIGTGVIAHRHMAIYANIQKNAHLLGFTAKVVAIAEIDAAKLKAFAEMYGFDEKDCYTDFRRMLARDDIDTVDVNVHNNLHTPISIEVMKRGYDCYTEKPAAASYHDAQMMIDAAKALGRKFHVQISSLMTPQTRVAKKMIENGELGDVYYVNLESFSRHNRPGFDPLPFDLPNMPPLTTDFYSKRVAGHGKSIDIGVYLISQIIFILGLPEIESVNGFAGQHVPVDPRLVTNPDGFGVEDIADGFAKFTNGVGFHMLTATAGHYKDYGMTYVLGSKGGLEITGTDTGGGRFAREGNRTMAGFPMRFGGPELTFHGEQGGRDVDIELHCDQNGKIEERLDPSMLLYNDNQCMWLAYKLGILDDTTRYNTPEVAARMLQLTDGIFLSQELHRAVTGEEIRELSPALYIPEQEIDGELVHYDLEF